MENSKGYQDRPGMMNGRPDEENGRTEVENGRPEVENGRPDLEVNNRRPKLKDIHSLQIFNWHSVGLELGLEDVTLRIIEHNHPRDLNGAKIDMLSTWLDQDVDATYEKLAKALVAVGEEICAEKLANKIGKWSTIVGAIRMHVKNHLCSQQGSASSEKHNIHLLLMASNFPCTQSL